MAGLLDWVDPAREWWQTRPQALSGLLGAAYQLATDPAARESAMARQPKPFTDESAKNAQAMAEGFWNPAGLLGVLKPRVFYRGTNPGATERISTGRGDWDSYLFAADNPKSAGFYGNSIEKIEALPEAKILYEGTKEFRSIGKGLNGSSHGLNMLDWANEITRRAKEAGFDAVHFKRQTDIGTPIINESVFLRGRKPD